MPSTARRHLDAMRMMLDSPPRDEQLWIDMNENERESVLIAAGLPGAWRHRFWRHLQLRERAKIMDAVGKMSAWAQRLQGPA